MRKYWQFLTINIQNSLAYRGPMLVWILSGSISVYAIIAVWLAAKSNGLIGGYKRDELITYYILGLFLQWAVNWTPFYSLKDEISEGTIVGTVLVKPLSLYFKMLFSEAGWRIVAVWVGVMATIFFAVIYRNSFVLRISANNAIPLFGSILLAILTVYTLSLCMGLSAFWLTNVSTLDALYWSARIFLGGQGIPISFFNPSARLLIELLPFRYMISFPLEIYFGKVNDFQMREGFIVSLLWIMALTVLYKVLMARGVKAYEAYGN